MAEKCAEEAVMDKLELSLGELEKKYVTAVVKLIEQMSNGDETEALCSQDQHVELPKCLPRFTDIERDQDVTCWKEVNVAKETLYAKEAEVEALATAVSQAHLRLMAARQQKAAVKKELEEALARKTSFKTYLAVGRKTITEAVPVVEKLERDLAKYQSRLTKCEDVNLKNRESSFKLQFYRYKAETLRQEMERLEKENKEQTQKAREVEEICQQIYLEEKTFMEKLEDCYKENEKKELEVLTEISLVCDKKWIKIDECLKWCDHLVEITTQEIKDLHEDLANTTTRTEEPVPLVLDILTDEPNNTELDEVAVVDLTIEPEDETVVVDKLIVDHISWLEH